MASGAILLLARDRDPAVALLRRLAPDRVRHVRPVDLSRPGWRYVGGRPDLAVAVAEETCIPAARVAAVISRLHWLGEWDFPHVHAADRSYAAAESSAFLLAWLAQFRRVRVNPPSPTCLCGPALSHLEWAAVAARAGLSVRPSRSAHRLGATPLGTVPGGPMAEVTVIAGRVLAAPDREVVDMARRLADAVAALLLRAWFHREAGGGWAFSQAEACPALDAGTAAALLEGVDRMPCDGGARCRS